MSQQHLIVDHMPAAVRWCADTVSLAAIIGTLAGWLPNLAALAGLIWYLILILDRFGYLPWKKALKVPTLPPDVPKP